MIYAVLPNLFQGIDGINKNPKFLGETNSREIVIKTKALEEDVVAGLAKNIGDKISRTHTIAPVGILFEQVARQNPADPESPKIGLGRFHAELWILSWFGIDFSNFSKAWLVAIRFFFDALFPFILLFFISFFTRSVPDIILNRFFAKLHTPVQATKEGEAIALEESYKNFKKFDRRKLFPGSKWEIMKPKRIDYIGFFGSWVLVGFVILLLWLMVSIK